MRSHVNNTFSEIHTCDLNPSSIFEQIFPNKWRTDLLNLKFLRSLCTALLFPPLKIQNTNVRVYKVTNFTNFIILIFQTFAEHISRPAFLSYMCKILEILENLHKFDLYRCLYF